jgi:predicted TIM-barrel fold metal-dependent hydrolase
LVIFCSGLAALYIVEPASRQAYVLGHHECILPEGCDSDERALKYVVADLKGENIVWNTDYPHPDAIGPKRALPDLDAQPISDEHRRKILWDNSVKLFGSIILD